MEFHHHRHDSSCHERRGHHARLREHFRHEFGGFGHGFDFNPRAMGFGRGRGRGGRGRRGDVRSAILILLAEKQMHGYELIQQIVERSQGLWKPSPGSIYPALAQLEDEGLVSIDKVAGRKVAQLTNDGHVYVTENRDELGDPWADVAGDVGEGEVDLRKLLKPLMIAIMQVGTSGTAAQVKQATELLDETRRSLYRILADGDQE